MPYLLLLVETDCVAGHVGLELANVALTRRDLNRSLPGVREKSLVRKCSVNPRSSAEITKNRHFRVRVLPAQPRSQVSVGDGKPVMLRGIAAIVLGNPTFP